MFAYTLTRLVYLALVLAVMSVLIFLVTQAMPGDVASMIAGQFASKEVVDAIAVKLGLDQPLIVQYGHWAAGILRGDLGRSLVLEQPISRSCWRRWPARWCWPWWLCSWSRWSASGSACSRRCGAAS